MDTLLELLKEAKNRWVEDEQFSLAMDVFIDTSSVSYPYERLRIESGGNTGIRYIERFSESDGLTLLGFNISKKKLQQLSCWRETTLQTNKTCYIKTFNWATELQTIVVFNSDDIVFVSAVPPISDTPNLNFKVIVRSYELLLRKGDSRK